MNTDNTAISYVIDESVTTNLPFSVALELMRNGRVAKRAGWVSGDTSCGIEIARGSIAFADGRNRFIPSNDDLLAKDWEVLP